MKKIHEFEWNEEKITSLWEMYETIPEFQEKFLPVSFYKELLRYIGKFIKKKGKVLDVGVGIGTLIEQLYSLGFEVWGVGISQSSLNQLLKRYISEGKNINLEKGSITDLPFNSNSFDYVFATEVLEHLLPEKQLPALLEVKRVLKNGGRFIITVPYKENIQKVVCPDCHAVFVPSQHLASFDEEKIKKIFSDGGFKIEFCKLVPKIPLTGNKIKNFIKRFITLIDKRAISFMYGSIFITVASKQG